MRSRPSSPTPSRLALLAAAFAAALAAAGGAGCGRSEPIKVGFVSGLSGRNYDLGISSRNGVQLAIGELNAAGGIGGRPIELVVRDDEQRPEAARAAVEELVRQGVVAIIGHNTSSMAEATLPIIEREKVLMISPTVSSSNFRGLDDWLIMLYPSTAESAAKMADWLSRNGAPKRVSALYDLGNRAYTQSWFDHFREDLAKFGGTVDPFPFTSGQVDQWGALAAKALAARPEAVLLIANALDSATLAQQLRKRSPSVRLLGTDWGFTHDVLSHGGGAVEGAIFMQKVDVNSTAPAYRRFKGAYEARYNRPVDFAAIMAYESAQVLAASLRKDATRAGVRAALLGLGTFHGLQGDFTIDRFGDAQRRHLVMTVRDGQMVLLE
jgi:branched-chain amino acid transport system substrate-binding protein